MVGTKGEKLEKKCWIELHLINSEFAKKIVGEVS